jgi:hypothetical protein
MLPSNCYILKITKYIPISTKDNIHSYQKSISKYETDKNRQKKNPQANAKQ